MVEQVIPDAGKLVELAVFSGLKPCDACAGTGQPSPWEWDHIVWRDRVPLAVCGDCRGSGLLTRWGFRVSQARSAKIRAYFVDHPAELVAHLRAASSDTAKSEGEV